MTTLSFRVDENLFLKIKNRVLGKSIEKKTIITFSDYIRELIEKDISNDRARK